MCPLHRRATIARKFYTISIRLDVLSPEIVPPPLVGGGATMYLPSRTYRLSLKQANLALMKAPAGCIKVLGFSV